MNAHTATLEDFGELRLIEEVILPIAREFDVMTTAGDDCAYLSSSSATLAVTADVGPKPLLHNLETFENDYEAAGWLAVVATASDVATAGAKPFFLTNCIDAPPTFLVRDFELFLRGYFSACSEFGFLNGGGDVRHGPTLSIRVFGAGQCEHSHRIGRAGAQQGDHLVLLGAAGLFMATYLLAKKKHPSVFDGGSLKPEAIEILRRPRPQLRALKTLAPHGVFSASSDTSDGLMGAIDNISRSSKCGFNLALTSQLLSEAIVQASSQEAIDPWNIFNAWGDWSVVATVPERNYSDFVKLCSRHDIEWKRLGVATANSRDLFECSSIGSPRKLNVVRNENFVSRGFNAGVQGHLDYMLKTPLFI